MPGAWKVQSAVSDLKAGLKQLGITKDVTLVAHSQAGEIANNLAQDDPEMLSGAVLVDANLPQFFTDEEISRLVAATQPDVDAAKKDPEKLSQPPAHLHCGGLRRSAPGLPQGGVAYLSARNGHGLGEDPVRRLSSGRPALA